MHLGSHCLCVVGFQEEVVGTFLLKHVEHVVAKVCNVWCCEGHEVEKKSKCPEVLQCMMS
jgi:hypothetical protein